MTDSVGLKDVKIPIQRISPLTMFRTRGRETLGYRLYPAWSENLLVLIHGIGGDSRYLSMLAFALADAGLATVVTPDLRGHGVEKHGPRASVAKPSQLEEDLEETLIHVRMNRGFSRLAWGGHSMGGALASRMALASGTAMRSGLLLIAPMLPATAAASKPNFGGWISASDGVIRVNMPELFKTGTEVLEYDESFFRAAEAPPDLAARLKASGLRVRAVVGDQDQVFDPDTSASYLSQTGEGVVRRVDTHHLGVVAIPAAIAVVRDAVEDLFA